MNTEGRRASWRRYERRRREVNDSYAVVELAKQHVRGLVRHGRLAYSGRCSVCGALGCTVFHHYDYTAYSDVVELCRKCHSAAHRRCHGKRR